MEKDPMIAALEALRNECENTACEDCPIDAFCDGHFSDATPRSWYDIPKKRTTVTVSTDRLKTVLKVFDAVVCHNDCNYCPFEEGCPVKISESCAKFLMDWLTGKN